MAHGSTKVTNGTKILPCTCAHAFQDATYSPHNRVHNGCAGKSPNSETYRCTVCKAEQNV